MEEGIAQSSIASILGISDSTVSRLIVAYDTIESGGQLSGSLTNSTNIVRWVCEKLGKSYDVVTGHSQMPAVEQNDANRAAEVELIVEAIGKIETAIDNLDKRLSAMQMTLQSFRQESQESTKKIVESINVNGDIATKEREKIADKIEAVKMNTRSLRRPGSSN